MIVKFIDTPYLVAICVTYNPESEQVEGPRCMVLINTPEVHI